MTQSIEVFKVYTLSDIYTDTKVLQGQYSVI